MLISIINHTRIKQETIQKTIDAINHQLSNEFKQHWDINAQLCLQTKKEITQSAAIIHLYNKINPDSAIEDHLNHYPDIPASYVFTELCKQSDEPWSVALSHTTLEFAVNPLANCYETGPHPDTPEKMVFYWREICDPVQKEYYEIDGIQVSNFVLKPYFQPQNNAKTPKDFLGHQPLHSFGINPGGFIGYYDHTQGEIYFNEDAEGSENRFQKMQAKTARREAQYEVQFAKCNYNQLDEEQTEKLLTFEAFVVELKNVKKGLKKIKSILNENWLIEQVECSKNEYDLIPTNNYRPDIQKIFTLYRLLNQSSDVIHVDTCYEEPITEPFDFGECHIHTIKSSHNVTLSSSIRNKHHPDTIKNTRWHSEFIKADKAWKIKTEKGKLFGEGIRIGHIDSGYRDHFELNNEHDDRIVNADLCHSLYHEADHELDDNNHGLGTASVMISSAQNPEKKFISGIAPRAELLPLNVTKRNHFSTHSLLMFGGMRKLRKAINCAVQNQCHIISISYGGVMKNKTVHNAIKNAVKQGIIVIASAGNRYNIVTYPARYDEVIAVAACNIEKNKWCKSGQGNNVDVSAPGESIWRASYHHDKQIVIQGHGTSYATAIVTGVAALWLAYWGRERLIKHFRNGEKMAKGFKKFLKDTSNKDHNLPGGFGVGIIDAEKLLNKKLSRW